MTDHLSLIRDVTDTARWTAAYRAEESERGKPLFRDPYAAKLAGERGFEIARRVKGQATRTGVVLRTAVFDELIAEQLASGRFDTVLMLATGLDARPYRLDLPADLRWVEVDLPSIIEYKTGILAEDAPRCALERVPLDLADRPARQALFERVAQASRGTLVLSEGLLAYLDPEDVATLAEDLSANPEFMEWATDLTGAQVMESVRDAGKEFKAGNSRVKFAPKENTAFFLPYGWRELDFKDLFAEAARLGRDGLTAKVLRFGMRFAPEAKRAWFSRAVGVALLGKVG